jgi:hypothetical protein
VPGHNLDLFPQQHDRSHDQKDQSRDCGIIKKGHGSVPRLAIHQEFYMVDCDNSAMGEATHSLLAGPCCIIGLDLGISIDEGTRQTDHPPALTAMT